MHDSEASDQGERNFTGTAFALLGLAACVAAVLTTGGLTMLAGLVATICLAGSFAAGVPRRESSFEQNYWEWQRLQAGDANDDLSICQDVEPSRHWQEIVEASRPASRLR